MNNKYESNIERVSDEEGEASANLCEIRFDCLVTMFEMGTFKQKDSPLTFKQEEKRKPQWFRSRSKLTMEAIKELPEHVLGKQLKDMLKQLEWHIDQYMV